MFKKKINKLKRGINNLINLPIRIKIIASAIFGLLFIIMYLDTQQKDLRRSQLLKYGLIKNDCFIISKWHFQQKGRDITSYTFECDFDNNQLKGNFKVQHNSSYHKMIKEFDIGNQVSLLYSELNPKIYSIIKINNLKDINKILYGDREIPPMWAYRVITGKIPNKSIPLDTELNEFLNSMSYE